MRQAGIIAAAGIVALESMVERLADDHDDARVLAEGLAEIPEIMIDLDRVQTNIVIFRLRDGAGSPDAFVDAMRGSGVLIGGIGKNRLRMVTHYGISRADIDLTLRSVGRILSTAR